MSDLIERATVWAGDEGERLIIELVDCLRETKAAFECERAACGRAYQQREELRAERDARPAAKWKEFGDSEFLFWGHIKVGEITLTGNGTWVAHYCHTMSNSRCLRYFPAPDLARAAVEEALKKATEHEENEG